MLIEVYRDEARKRAVNNDGVINAIKDGMFMIWTDERIKRAFANGHGTMKDFERYKRDNEPYIIIRDIDRAYLETLYPEVVY